MAETVFKLPQPQPSWRRVLAVWRRHQRVYFKFLWANAMPPLLEPVMFLLALGVGMAAYVGRVDGLSYAAFLAPGMIGVTAMWSASFETTYGTFFRMDYGKIYDGILGSPVSFNEMMIGELLWVASKCSFFSLCVLAVVSAAGLAHSWWALLSVPLGFIGGMLFALMGFLVTSRVREVNNFNFYLTGVIGPMFYFSGAVFPLDQLSGWMKALCLALPFTHMVALLQAALRGDFSGPLLWHLAALAGLIAALWPLSFRMLKKRILV